jgi:16S rRNA (adenine1518-N6/adenine1519-N6)-dimethyltransferase
MSLPALDVPKLLQRYGLRPDKGLGQNFLVDDEALQRVVQAAAIDGGAEHRGGESVLEVGAGLGSLTRWLALQARQVVAVELDDKLIPILSDVLQSSLPPANYLNVQIVQGDILALDPARLMAGVTSEAGYLVVANIPYYITSALIRHLLEARIPPRRMVLTVQREVAERICARPGDMSLLALSVQVYGAPLVAASIPASAFYPVPKIDSAVVGIELYPQPLIPIERLKKFFRLAKAGFSQKRKTLRNSLAGGMAWSPGEAQKFLVRAGIDPNRRAETLSLDEWERLASIAP